MSVAGIMLVKDEADIIEHSLRWTLSQVDEVIVIDNGSTDGTVEIIQEIAAGAPVIVGGDPQVAYYQADKMTNMAQVATSRGHEWVVPVDADEFWRTTDGTRIGDFLTALDGDDGGYATSYVVPVPEWLFVAADLYDHKVTGRDDRAEPSPMLRMGWRFREPSGLPKVACRCRPDLGLKIGMGNHDATVSRAYGTVSSTGSPPTLRGGLVVEHYAWRSEEQFLSKITNGQRAYAASNLPKDYGAHWRAFGAPEDETFEDAVRGWFREWAYVEDPTSDPALGYFPAAGVPS